MKTVDIVYRYEAREIPARPRPLDSASALARLENGNRDFAALLDSLDNKSGPAQRLIHVDAVDLGLVPGDTAAPRQRPFAAILGCSDARVPIEMVFGEGPNDLFVVRVAGNGLGSEVLGSLKYAVENLGGSLKLIVVLGHSGCGALAAAVDVFLNPSSYLALAAQRSLRNVLDHLLAVVNACATSLKKTFGPDIVLRPGYRKALIEAAIATNAALAAYSIEQEIRAGDAAGLRSFYGVYLLETRKVWTASPGNPQGAGLAAAPRAPAEFVELGVAIMQSTRIASLLASSG